MLIKCSVCGYEISENAKVCPRCGEDYSSKVFCKFCGKKIDKDAIVCVFCGKQVNSTIGNNHSVVINNANSNSGELPQQSHLTGLVIAWILTIFGYQIGLGIIAGIYTIVTLKRPIQGTVMIVFNLMMFLSFASVMTSV